jgi:hypothetical protein
VTNKDGWLLVTTPGPGLYDVHVGAEARPPAVLRAVPVRADCRTDVTVDLPS